MLILRQNAIISRQGWLWAQIQRALPVPAPVGLLILILILIILIIVIINNNNNIFISVIIICIAKSHLYESVFWQGIMISWAGRPRIITKSKYPVQPSISTAPKISEPIHSSSLFPECNLPQSSYHVKKQPMKPVKGVQSPRKPTQATWSVSRQPWQHLNQVPGTEFMTANAPENLVHQLIRQPTTDHAKN